MHTGSDNRTEKIRTGTESLYPKDTHTEDLFPYEDYGSLSSSEDLMATDHEDEQANRHTSQSSMDVNDSLDSCLMEAMMTEELCSLRTMVIPANGQPRKRPKLDHLTPMTFVRMNQRAPGKGKPKPITLKGLCDSGGSACILSLKYAKKLKVELHPSQIVFTTPTGAMTVDKKAELQFMLPEFYQDRVLTWDIYVTDRPLGNYDMIIGRDLMGELGFQLKFDTMEVAWNQIAIPMKPIDATPDEFFYIRESEAVSEATNRIKKILDAKYVKANLEEVAKANEKLKQEEQTKLLALLRKYESLFDGTLGTWKGSKYHIELKPDAKPYHAKAFPIPRIHQSTLKMEIERLCKLGVLKKVNQSEWAAPTFIIPKKDGTVRFISDFRELNKESKGNHFLFQRFKTCY